MKNWLEGSAQLSNDAYNFLRQAYSDPSFPPKFEKLQFLLHLIFSVAKRCKGIGNNPRPFSHYWKQIFPSLFSMLVLVHHLWYPELLTKYPLKAAIQQTYSEEVRALMGNTNAHEKLAHLFVDKTDQNDSAVDNEKKQLARLVYALAALRDSIYATLAESARYKRHGLFSDDEPMRMLSQSALARIECMENRHLAKFITVAVAPIVLNCPTDCLRQQTFPFLVSLLEHTLKRLQTCWVYFGRPNETKPAAVKFWGPLIPPPEVGGCESRDCGVCAWCQQSEIGWDASVRVLGNGMGELLGILLNTWPIAPETDPKELSPQALCEEVLACDEMAAATLFSLVDCVVCPDSAVSHKAMLVFRRIFYACLAYKPRYHNFIVDHLYKSCLRCLLNPPTKNNHATSMLFIQIIKDIFDFALGLEKNNKIVYQQSQNELLVKLEEPLMTIPGIGKDEIASFFSSFSKAQSSKTKRVNTKAFLQQCAESFGASNEILADRKNFQVKDLPSMHPIKAQHTIPSGNKKAEGGAWYHATSAFDLGTSRLFDT
uniref:Exportin-5 C-terminal domain-containing protein n=2 Tax=Aplanochytrium stocchinoi TaxID=215587 RepID=A0A7S3UYF0_9STRA